MAFRTLLLLPFALPDNCHQLSDNCDLLPDIYDLQLQSNFQAHNYFLYGNALISGLLTFLLT